MATQGHSIERRAVMAVFAGTLLAALAAIFVIWHTTRPRDQAADGSAAADAAVKAIAAGAAPEPLLQAFVDAGQASNATLYGKDGAVVASLGTPRGTAEQLCRSLSAGGTVCIEPRTAEAPTRRIATASGIALGASLVLASLIAWMLVRAIRAGVGELRTGIDTAMRDLGSGSRVASSAGALAPLATSINELLAHAHEREVAFRRRTHDLEIANKDLESFAHAVSHDLRGPLGSISGFAQALAEDFGGTLDETGKECVGWIQEGCAQMLTLIDALLQMSRLSRMEVNRENVNLSSVARAIALDLQRAAPERHVEFSIPEGIVASGDERLLRAVLLNLIGNAWKFTSKTQGARIELGVRDDNGQPAFYIRDNGAGFDPAHAAKMFRPFQRLHSSKEFEGTGIGLATVAKIIERHGGRAWAEGEPSRGATVWFTTGRSQAVA